VKTGLFCIQFVSGLFALNVAISAVYRLVAARLEGYLSFFAALCANSGEHLAGSASAHATAAITIAFCPSVLTANRTSFRLIGVAFGCEEFLLFYGKGESFSTIRTSEGFFLKCHTG
jgi:hypothetical protein